MSPRLPGTMKLETLVLRAVTRTPGLPVAVMANQFGYTWNNTKLCVLRLCKRGLLQPHYIHDPEHPYYGKTGYYRPQDAPVTH